MEPILPYTRVCRGLLGSLSLIILFISLTTFPMGLDGEYYNRRNMRSFLDITTVAINLQRHKLEIKYFNWDEIQLLLCELIHIILNLWYHWYYNNFQINKIIKNHNKTFVLSNKPNVYFHAIPATLIFMFHSKNSVKSYKVIQYNKSKIKARH